MRLRIRQNQMKLELFAKAVLETKLHGNWERGCESMTVCTSWCNENWGKLKT